MRRPIMALVPAVLVAACFVHPLGSEDEAVFDERLLGDWVSLEPEGHGPMRISVSRKDNSNFYSVQLTTPDSSGSATVEYAEAFAVTFHGIGFVNARGVTDPEWSIFRYSVAEDGTLTLVELSASKGEVAKLERAALAQYVRDHLDDEAVYDAPMRLRRIAR